MKDIRIGRSENGCVRKDNEPIYSPDTSSLDMMMPLVDLTFKTRATHSVHDFAQDSARRRFVNGWPLEGDAAGLHEILVASTDPIKNGDMIVTRNSQGDTILRMAFDVEAHPKKENIYKFITVRPIPDLHIGHSVSAP